MAANETPNTTVVETPKAAKRPLTLTIGAVILAAVALFTFATPFLPRVGGGGFGGNPGQRGTGRPTLAPGESQTPRGNFGGGGAGGGANGGATGLGGTTGFGGAAGRAGGNFAAFSLMQPIRIAEAVIGGLFALVAAIGLMQRKKWGMVLAVIAAIVIILTTAVTLLTPLLGRAARAFTLYLTFVTRPTWESAVLVVATVAVAVLALLPASRKAYVVKPRERRVM